MKFGPLQLWIDTTSPETIQLGVLDGNKWVAERTVTAPRRQSEKLLPALSALLRAKRLSLTDVKGIAVATGPGPFTAVRIGVATANALAYALGVPVVGLKMTDSGSFATLPVRITKAFRANKGRTSVVPAYGREPNITLSSRI